LLLLRFIWNIQEKVDDGVIHLTEIHAVVFNAPSWCIWECKSKLQQL
jgi:hypothetical protein